MSLVKDVIEKRQRTAAVQNLAEDRAQFWKTVATRFENGKI